MYLAPQAQIVFAVTFFQGWLSHPGSEQVRTRWPSKPSPGSAGGVGDLGFVPLSGPCTNVRCHFGPSISIIVSTKKRFRFATRGLAAGLLRDKVRGGGLLQKQSGKSVFRTDDKIRTRQD